MPTSGLVALNETARYVAGRLYRTRRSQGRTSASTLHVSLLLFA